MQEFTKMSAAGNDFIIIDSRKEDISLSKEQIKHLANRQNIGCDQLIIIKNHQGGKQESKIDCFIEIYNADGSQAQACGNATRCVAKMIFEEGLDKKQIIIKTIADELQCWAEEDGTISVKMGIPKFTWEKIPMKEKCDTQNIKLFNLTFHALNIGNPHIVSFSKQTISDQTFFDIAPKIENHENFPEKTNVEFAKIISDDVIQVRVWERGTGETLACGSGACAVGALAIKHKLIKKDQVTIRFKGGNIKINWPNQLQSIIMNGDCQKEFSGPLNSNLLL